MIPRIASPKRALGLHEVDDLNRSRRDWRFTARKGAEIGKVVHHRLEAAEHVAKRPQVEAGWIIGGEVDKPLHALQRRAKFVRHVRQKARARPGQTFGGQSLRPGFGQFVEPLVSRITLDHRRAGMNGEPGSRSPARPDFLSPPLVVIAKGRVAERPRRLGRAFACDAGLET